MRFLYIMLSSKKLAIVLLVLITAVYITGMVVPQEHLLSKNEFSRWLAVNPTFGPMAQKVGLSSFFSAWWFLCMVSLLFFNTLFCMVRQGFTLITKFKGKSPQPVQFEKWPHREELKGSPAQITGHLTKAGYRTRVTEWGIYAYKHRWAQTASLVFHLGILIVITGGLVSALWKTSGVVRLTEGQTFGGNIHEYLQTEQGYLAKIPEDPFLVGIDGVESMKDPISGKEKNVSQVVTFDREGNVVEKREVRVNQNLSVVGHTFYISRFGYSPGIIISRDGREVFAAYAAVSYDEGKDVYRGDLTIPSEEWSVMLEYLPTSEISVIIKEKSSVLFENTLKIQDSVDNGQIKVEYMELRESVEFIVARDPGVNLVFAGGMVALMGLVILYFSAYRQIAVVFKSGRGQAMVYGRAERFRYSFSAELSRITDTLKGEPEAVKQQEA